MKSLKIIVEIAVVLLLFMAISTVAMKQIERDKWHKFHRCEQVTSEKYKCDVVTVVLP